MRLRTALPLSIAALAAIPVSAHCSPDKTSAPADATALPWMASYDAAKDVRVGMDEADVNKWIEKTHKNEWPGIYGIKNKEAWEKIRNQVVLLQTPSWKTDVPAFHLSKFELTNAQWARFLEARQETYETQGEDTLKGLVTTLWRVEDSANAQAEITRGWRLLLAMNKGVLGPVLNPKNDPKWDEMVARAQDVKLPKGLKLQFTRYMPPPHWAKDGTVPPEQAKKPMRFVSWEQAADFCRWAGFHLPTEFEWERAARGTEARKLTWEGDWDPLRAVWKGYNRAAIAAKKPEFPPVVLPGQESDPPADMPGPMDVDLLAGGATPEGVLHMLGNVSELTSSLLTRYPGSKSTNSFMGDFRTLVARGGNFDDRAEILLASDRNAEGQGGPLLPTDSIFNYGFRLAAYPVAGADLTHPLAQRYSDTVSMGGLGAWLPLPAGCTERKDVATYGGFEAQRTAGVLERQIANDSATHVFVAGPAAGIAFLPVKGFPLENVKTPEDLKALSVNAERPIVLGILTGTDNAEFEIVVPGGRKAPFACGAPEFRHKNPNFVQTSEVIGAVLILEGDKVAVYKPNDTLKGPAKYRKDLLGTLEFPVEIVGQKGTEAPSGRVEARVEGKPEGDVAVLTTTIPLLDKKGNAGSGSSAYGIKVTLRIPYRRIPSK